MAAILENYAFVANFEIPPNRSLTLRVHYIQINCQSIFLRKCQRVPCLGNTLCETLLVNRQDLHGLCFSNNC